MFNKFIYYLKHPMFILLRLDNNGIIRLKDSNYLKLLYKKLIGKKLNLKNPQTFNEKLQWLKLYDRKDIYTTMVDKYEVKKYVGKIIGEEYIIPTLGVYEKFKDINFDNLPNQFVIKCTHDSGGLVVCNNKEKFNYKKAKEKIEKSLRNNYYYSYREWPYKNVKPKIIIEEYIGENLCDYKFFCFNGEPEFTLVCSNRNGNDKNTDFYDNDWNKLPFTRQEHKNNPKGIEKPKKFEKMLIIARELSKNIPFVRIDLYNTNNKIYFGEITFYPSSGFEGFNPSYWDNELGKLININNNK